MFIVISGCSGGGKSTTLEYLARRGYSVVKEPARRILEEAKQDPSSVLPWVDAAKFGKQVLAMSIADRAMAHGLTFFDRGVVDAAVAVTATGGELPAAAIARCRYDLLFLAPPWPEIYVTDPDRRHGFETAERDYKRIQQAYLTAGYDPVMLPLDSVVARVNVIIKCLENQKRQ